LTLREKKKKDGIFSCFNIKVEIYWIIPWLTWVNYQMHNPHDREKKKKPYWLAFIGLGLMKSKPKLKS
jgi:hypothetical protein